VAHHVKKKIENEMLQLLKSYMRLIYCFQETHFEKSKTMFHHHVLPNSA